MRVEMNMPDLATTGSEIRVVRWIARVGEAVKRGQPLLEIETDKATMEVESAIDGVLTETAAGPDDLLSAGQLLATFEVAAANPAPIQPAGQDKAVAAPMPAAPAPAKPRAGGMFARNRAAADARAATAGDAPDIEKRTEPAGFAMSVAHRTAARRLTESKQTVPHFYLQTSFNAKSITARRKVAEPKRLAWDAFFVHAVGRALKRFSRLACRLDGDRLVPAPADAVGVAVDAEGELYVIPIARPAERTPEQISDEIRALVNRLRAGDPDARRLPQVAMTVTNLGSCNVESFVPIINPPEAAILGVGKAVPTPVARETHIAVEPRATLTLAVDHRVVNGKYAGDFLGAVVAELEALAPEAS